MSEKLTAVERLEEMLNERDARIEELEGRIEELEGRIGDWEDSRDEDAWFWTRHEKVDDKDGLPVPRLEIRWTPLGRGRYNWLASYNLAYRHLLGHVMSVPLGATRQSGGDERGPVREGKVETPFRDGVHIMHDAWALKLPAYAVCGDVVTKIEPGTREQREGK